MKVGILGGTFDPVHYGHLDIAKQALEEMSLDELVIVPANLQPFKLNVPVTDSIHRVEMLKIAFDGMEKVKISEYELNKDEISYTINTLNEFKKIYEHDFRKSDVTYLLKDTQYKNINFDSYILFLIEITWNMSKNQHFFRSQTTRRPLFAAIPLGGDTSRK